jgi:hypothetical protein
MRKTKAQLEAELRSTECNRVALELQLSNLKRKHSLALQALRHFAGLYEEPVEMQLDDFDLVYEDTCRALGREPKRKRGTE